MQNTLIIDALKAALTMETQNSCTATPHAIIITFPDQTKAIIMAHQITATNNLQRRLPNHQERRHTYHYRHRHDFNHQQPLILQNIEDCRSYLEDACQTFFAAKFRDFELTFPDGDIFLITLAPYQT